MMLPGLPGIWSRSGCFVLVTFPTHNNTQPPHLGRTWAPMYISFVARLRFPFVNNFWRGSRSGSYSVMHLVGAERAACAIIALDTPGANYRTVYTMSKHFPHVKTYVRAHDMTNAGAVEKGLRL